MGTSFERIVLVKLISSQQSQMEAEDELEELGRLVETLHGKVVGELSQRRDHPHRELYLGPGKVTELKELVLECEADTVVVDGRLSPIQVSELEHQTGIHIMDRSELILEIFSRRAKTAEAKMQVELAYLDYIHPKMNKSTRLRAYRGGIRGFGESPLEKRLRTAKARAEGLREKLKLQANQREMRIKRRADIPSAALVGYTNAGKSTLLNVLSGESLYADDRLFATLDTTTRRVFLKTEKYALISDTVGFISRLPHELIASFHSTLAEALAANLLIHVVDASTPLYRQQMETVDKTLEELGISETPRLLVFNKIDATDEETREHLSERYPEAVLISAIQKNNIDTLRQMIHNHLYSVL